MKTTDPSFLLPGEFTEAIAQPSGSDDDPDSLHAAVREQWAHRHPDLAETDATRYRVPVTTSLFLYRRNPKEHRALALSAPGSPQSPHFSSLLAAVARDAYEHRDWSLLGKLAWKLETGAVSCSRGTWDSLAEGQSGAAEFGRRWQLAPGKIQAAFIRLLDYPAGRVTAPEYVTLGLAYFSSIPDNFVFPVDWSMPPESNQPCADENRWPVLRLLCRKNGAAWQAVPDALERAQKLSNPFLQPVMGLLARQNSVQPSSHNPLVNPFRKLAGAVGEEPAKGVMGRFVRKVTGRSARAEPTVQDIGTVDLEIEDEQ